MCIRDSVYSPISLYIALSMLREMADGETKLKLDEFLKVGDINLANAIKNLIENEHAKDGLVAVSYTHLQVFLSYHRLDFSDEA